MYSIQLSYGGTAVDSKGSERNFQNGLWSWVFGLWPLFFGLRFLMRPKTKNRRPKTKDLPPQIPRLRPRRYIRLRDLNSYLVPLPTGTIAGWLIGDSVQRS